MKQPFHFPFSFECQSSTATDFCKLHLGFQTRVSPISQKIAAKVMLRRNVGSPVETSLLSVSAESCSRNNELDRAALGREREEGSTRRPFVLVSNGPGFPYTQKPARRVSDRRESRE